MVLKRQNSNMNANNSSNLLTFSKVNIDQKPLRKVATST